MTVSRAYQIECVDTFIRPDAPGDVSRVTRSPRQDETLQQFPLPFPLFPQVVDVVADAVVVVAG
jgi:hypothetical protein